MDTNRVRTLPFSHGKVGKILSYLSFYAGAVIGALTGPRPDVVVTLTTPPGLAWIGWFLQKLRGSRHVVWEMDVYPDIAVDLGMRAWWSGWLFDFPRVRADRVIALGACMAARLVRRGVEPTRIAVCENWAGDYGGGGAAALRSDELVGLGEFGRVGQRGQTDLSTAVASLPSGQIESVPFAEADGAIRVQTANSKDGNWRQSPKCDSAEVSRDTEAATQAASLRSDELVGLEEFGRLGQRGQTDLSTAVASLPSGQIESVPFAKFRVVYSGNLGLAHEVGTISDVMQRLDTERFEFVFAGGGPRRASLEDRCRDFRNVRFEAWTEDLGERLAGCDLGLVTQRPETVGSVVPSKTYGLMAAGRAILYIGPGAATPARVIREFGCGWQFECGDVEGVAGLLEELAARPELAREAGARGRVAYEKFYCRDVGVGRVVDVILAVATNEHE